MTAFGDIPPHLRQFVVAQNYARYTARDQAVWRFSVSNSHARLLHTAPVSYARGFDAAGISVDRIPRIEEVNQRLQEIGWSAVCVDGFIPPRAFQAFQAHGVLPIAAEVRTSQHLTYTPAPDIIHEAAGHAPFLQEPTYARYLRRIGEVGGRAFGKPEDEALYQAIYRLSVVKEDPASTPQDVARAEQAFEETSAAMGGASEAAKLARFYWWTVEYGLVGTPADLRSYGAGLLSSISEGTSSQDERVIKLPLSPACADVTYDITRPQPQLFFARDFAKLEPALEEVTKTLSQSIGGRYGLETALASQEVATLTLDSRIQVVGTVVALHGEGKEPALVELSGRCALALDYQVLTDLPSRQGYVLPLGALADGTALSALDCDALRRLSDGDRLALSLQDGVQIRGKLGARLTPSDKPLVVALHDCEISQRGKVLLRSQEPYAWALGARVQAVAAGAAAGHDLPTDFSHTDVPKPRVYDTKQRHMIELHERLDAARAQAGSELSRACEQMLVALQAQYPDEWLLRWNLLEAVVRANASFASQAELEAELERLELHYERLEPIATGLAYVRALPHYRQPRATRDAESP